MHGKRMKRSPVRQDDNPFEAHAESTSVQSPREIEIVKPKNKLQKYMDDQETISNIKKNEEKVYSKTDQNIENLKTKNALINAMSNLTS